PLEVIPELPVTDRAHRRAVPAEPRTLPEARDLLDETFPEHGLETLADAPGQLSARRRHEPEAQPAGARLGRGAFGLPLRDRPPAQLVDLERALDALRVVRRDARRRRRIGAGEPPAQRRPAVPRRLPLPRPAE